LEAPRGDYQKQAQDNMKGARLTEIREETGPPDMYYDRANNKQTQASPETLQTAQKNIPLTTT